MWNLSRSLLNGERRGSKELLRRNDGENEPNLYSFPSKRKIPFSLFHSPNTRGYIWFSTVAGYGAGCRTHS